MSECDLSGNEYDGRLGLRISSIFVILVGSALGALFPVYASRHRGTGVPEWAFFIAKYFGSGVIVATAFIHLLAPAEEALKNECLTGPITEYTWVEGIVLMTVFVLFFVELMTMRYAKFGLSHDHDTENVKRTDLELNGSLDVKYQDEPSVSTTNGNECPTNPHVPGDDHLWHAKDHQHPSNTRANSGHAKTFDPDSYAAQMTAVFILEFGVIFHSIFIGLTLAVSGAEFDTLYVVLTFHQTFEGLALGSRLGSITWPESKRFTPYLLGLGYALSTPIAIAIGLGVRTALNPNSQSFLIINGVFDSISAGILIYTGLVELMAHEFMFSSYMQKAPIRLVLAAVGCMVLGALLMAILGKWA
ncbi:Putative zinc/iron permease [Septoria linicola]|uniref:Zinc/iron permease n=1 Tax=Septoria linicola TaxID=215465 RepID=A0A9Q9AKV7_9PEZI|nr:putative zinc/iron permease [Septoria linicola]USW48295.1 Putative zinc/iron permease [Septoria linicola]